MKPTVPTPINTFAAEWQIMKEQATILHKSQFLPDSIKTPEQCIAIMMKGKEIGMQPMQALTQINLIKGRATLSAEGMLAMVFKYYPGTQLDYLQNDDQACMIEVQKPGGRPNHFQFTIEDAKKAQLLSNSTWQKYPRAMLRSRCISEMCRSLFPDAIQGCSYTPEELEAIPAEREIVAAAHITRVPEKNPSPAIVHVPKPSIIELFAKEGISEEDLKEFIGKPFEEKTEQDIEDLRKAYKEISAGNMQRDDFLEHAKLRNLDKAISKIGNLENE